MPPPWLSVRGELPGRGALVAAARARLAESGLLALTGAPGIGKTAVAGALLAGGTRRLVAVSAVGCEEPADLVRALGAELGLAPIGDEGALLEALRGPIDLLVDDVEDDNLLEPVHRAAAANPDLRLIVVGEHAMTDALEVGPLEAEHLMALAPGHDVSTFEGSPLLALMAAAFGAPPAEALRRLGAAAALLASFPPGFAAMTENIATVATIPDARDRVVLRRGVAARLPRLSAQEAGARALRLVEPLMPLARGAHPTRPPDPRDLLLLRALARTVDPEAAARCTAAAARLAVIAGQVQFARGLLAERLRIVGSSRAQATLLWADGDALLAAGEVEDALRRWADASALFARVRDPRSAATVHRRAGDRLAARGQLHLAEAHYRLARPLYRSVDDSEGAAATLRGAADLAMAAGEWVSAGTLQEQVADAIAGSSPAERANATIGEATLAIARGEYTRAARLLDGLTSTEPLLRANVARRRADLLLRRGDHDAARAEARAAGAGYAALGEAAAHAACVRLDGDIAAAAGWLDEARALYRSALRLQVRGQDLAGLSRTLEHAATLEEALGEAALARRMREQRASVREVM